MAICPNCNKIFDEGGNFCDCCGAALTESPVEELSANDFTAQEQIVVVESEIIPVKKKGSAGKTVVLILLGIVILSALLVAYIISFGGSSGKINYALYLKDNEMYFSNLKKNSEPFQLTSKLFDPDDYSSGNNANADNKKSDNYYFNNARNIFASFTYMSESGKYIFFPDKSDSNLYTCNLYYKQVDKADAEAIKIDSDIACYTVNASATVVTYVKLGKNTKYGDPGTLYQYSIREAEKEKIASDVLDFVVSDDGNKLGYRNADSDIYLKYAGKDEEKIASNISYVKYINEDFNTIYYVKDQNLYRLVEGEDKEKIASDVCNIIKVYDSGEIYYLTGEDKESSLMDFIADDKKDADASLSEPKYPDFPEAPTYPYSWNYISYADYEAAYEAYEEAYEEYELEYERLKEEYDAACKVYEEKKFRDQLRTSLEGEVLEQSVYSLCFYNGKNETVITDGYTSRFSVALDTPVISYEAFEPSSIKKVKLSEVQNVYDVQTMVEDSISSSSEKYIAVKNAVTTINEEKEVTSIRINASGTLVYYIDNIPDEEYHGDLYRICISNGSVGKAELYDSDVYTDCNFIDDTDYLYYKEVEGEGWNDTGELYISKKMINDDVYVTEYSIDETTGHIFYITDYDDETYKITLNIYDGKKTVEISDDVGRSTITPDGRVVYLYDYDTERLNGELYVWSKGKKTKISDDVYAFQLTPDGEILYLHDYSTKHYEGTLYVWSDGKAKLIDEDVVSILPIYSSEEDFKYHGYGYGYSFQ